MQLLEKIQNVKPAYQHLELVGKFLLERGTKPDMEITSLPTINTKLWGIGKKKMVVIGARPSNGKSALAMQIAFDVSKTHKVLVLSLEQTIEETIERMFCNCMSVDNQELLRGGFMMFQKEWEEFQEILKSRKLIITESIGKSWGELDRLLSEMETYPDLVIIDYLNRISTIGINKRDAVDEYLRHMSALAKQNNFGIIICCQISRRNVLENMEPTLEGLKECIHPDSIIDGKRIEDIVENNLFFPITTYNTKTGEREKIIPSKLIKSGKQECVEITTSSGKKIILSKDTEIYDGVNWVKARDVREDSNIYVDN